MLQPRLKQGEGIFRASKDLPLALVQKHSAAWEGRAMMSLAISDTSPDGQPMKIDTQTQQDHSLNKWVLHQPSNFVHVQPRNLLLPAMSWLKDDAGAIHQVVNISPMGPASQQPKREDISLKLPLPQHWSQKSHSYLASKAQCDLHSHSF